MDRTELGNLVGYELKRAQAALRATMDARLRRHDLTVPQYVCLELLDGDTARSNADLARDAFVTRQSMNVVLRNLEAAGLVTRPDQAPHGRALPAQLTPAGTERLRAARADILTIEQRMTADLTAERLRHLLSDLKTMASALGEPAQDHTT
ncbi:MarR family winged helix-turn-helix transcriptional regulator [Nocardia wallacei]|uniref:MarR family winged helix-turn-helix transcriptional regulator n=1 Tax=Nocardia wallacei TaxID=480035 RepID=UPI002455CA7D|nr:MarR family transcriptional regulator [Nocardia wallacei]